MLWQLLLIATVLSWACIWALMRAASRSTPELETIYRRLQFTNPQPRLVAAAALPAPDPATASVDRDEVRQIMRQLGRSDAAGRAMAERILTAAGPRRPL